MRDDALKRGIHFVGGFLMGAFIGGILGGMIGTWIGYHQKLLHEPLARYELQWAWIWPFALGFGVLIGLGMALRWQHAIRGWVLRLRGFD